MTNKQIYIIPGFGSTPDDHWFPWLSSKLNCPPNQQVKTVKLPDPQKPRVNSLLLALEEQLSLLDEDTYLVTHSLGGLTTLLYLSRLFRQSPNLKIGGIILVSGFYQKRDSMSSPNEFFEEKIDFNVIKKITKENIIVISSANDYIVPTELTDNLAQKLNADYYRKRENGHFMGIDGYKKFSLLLTLLNYLLKNKK